MVHLLDLRLAFGRYESQLGKSATELKILQLWKNRRRDFKWHIDIWQILTDIDIWQYDNMIDIDILDKDCIYVRLELRKISLDICRFLFYSLTHVCLDQKPVILS